MTAMRCAECGATGPNRQSAVDAETDAAWHDHAEHGDRPTAAVVRP